MRYQAKILAILLMLVCARSFSQMRYTSALSIDKNFKDTFTFQRQWAYDWGVLKEDDGSFSKAFGGKVKAADTAHLFYTANCSTNVQGGYHIRYSYAEKINDELVLTFEDGLPAYASVFWIHIKNDSFYFKPKTIYPQPTRGKLSYHIDSQKLVLNKNQFSRGELVKGYIDFQFTEVTSTPGNESHDSKYFLRGYFRTPLRSGRK
jgi:hypothetical protein